MTIAEITQEIYANNFVKGFNDEPDVDKWVASQLANMHAEVSELWDAYRSGTEREPCDKCDKMVLIGFPPNALTKEEEECADIIIRALGFARHRGIDIARAMFVKHVYNTTRPHMHGKKN